LPPPLPSWSIDFITADQALHWFDLEKVRAEFARVQRVDHRREELHECGGTVEFAYETTLHYGRLAALPAAGKRHSRRLEYLPISGEQRRIVNYAGRGDDLIGGITAEVQFCNRATHGQLERPHVNARQRTLEFRRMNVQFDAAELEKLRQFPENDGGDAP